MEKENKTEKKSPKKSKALAECEKQRDENLAGWQRERADFANYKKEEAKRSKEMKEYWDEIWMMKIIELIDNLERADCHMPQEIQCHEWMKARLSIEKLFLKSLQEEGLKELNPINEKFDPNFHEAIEQVEAEGESGTIAQVVQKGYLFNNKLLRASRVKVIK